jgi:acyl-CoA hydrolase
MQTYRERLKTADEAAALVPSGSTVYLGSGCAAPHELTAALTRRAPEVTRSSPT